MIKSFKLLIVFGFILVTINSCGTVKEGFSMQKKNNSDEFLVEKKSPLLMPPNFDELPTPNPDNISENNQDTTIEKLISKKDNSNATKNDSDKIKGSLEESLLEKIKNN